MELPLARERANSRRVPHLLNLGSDRPSAKVPFTTREIHICGLDATPVIVARRDHFMYPLIVNIRLHCSCRRPGRLVYLIATLDDT